MDQRHHPIVTSAEAPRWHNDRIVMLLRRSQPEEREHLVAAQPLRRLQRDAVDQVIEERLLGAQDLIDPLSIVSSQM
jgi:hypothetical protein